MTASFKKEITSYFERENISSIVLGCGISTSEKVIALVDKITDFIKERNIIIIYNIF